MKVVTAAETPTRTADPAYFTGAVLQEPLADTPTEPPLKALRVSFAPGARTNWHTHPMGQTLVVVSGVGIVQARGEPACRILAGDRVWIEPGEVHWHGAAPGHAMVHLALQHAPGGRSADWLEPVSEVDYAAAASDILGEGGA